MALIQPVEDGKIPKDTSTCLLYTSYILAGKKKLADVRANELQQAMDKAKVSGLPEDAQAARDLADQLSLIHICRTRSSLPP